MSDANATWQGGGCKVPDSCLLHPRQFLFKRRLATCPSLSVSWWPGLSICLPRCCMKDQDLQPPSCMQTADGNSTLRLPCDLPTRYSIPFPQPMAWEVCFSGFAQPVQMRCWMVAETRRPPDVPKPMLFPNGIIRPIYRDITRRRDRKLALLLSSKRGRCASVAARLCLQVRVSKSTMLRPSNVHWQMDWIRAKTIQGGISSILVEKTPAALSN